MGGEWRVVTAESIRRLMLCVCCVVICYFTGVIMYLHRSTGVKLESSWSQNSYHFCILYKVGVI